MPSTSCSITRSSTPEELEEIGQELVPPGDIAGQRFAGGGQDQAAILLVFEEALAIEALHHVGDAGLRDAEARRDIDHAGVALGVDQLEDALQVILHRGGVAREACLGGHARTRTNREADSVKHKNILLIDKLIVTDN